MSSNSIKKNILSSRRGSDDGATPSLRTFVVRISIDGRNPFEVCDKAPASRKQLICTFWPFEVEKINADGREEERERESKKCDLECQMEMVPRRAVPAGRKSRSQQYVRNGT